MMGQPIEEGHGHFCIAEHLGPSDGSDFAFGHLCLEQLGAERHGGLKGGSALFDQLADSLSHAVYIEAA